MMIYLVNSYGVAFKNKEDAILFVREKDYNKQKLAYFKAAIGATYSEETILESINRKITEIELKTMKVYIIVKDPDSNNEDAEVEKAFRSYEQAEKYIIQKYWANCNPEDERIKNYAKSHIQEVELE